MDQEHQNLDADPEKEADSVNKILEGNQENGNRELTENMGYADRDADDNDYQDYAFPDYEQVPDTDDWDVGEAHATDWEKQAKRKVRIELEKSVENRRTIYDLDSYASLGPQMSDIQKETESVIEPQQIRYSVSLGMPGIARVDISSLTQKIIGCVIGENVTTEYPWIYVRKEIIQDNIELYDENSDFFYMKAEISAFPDTKMLIGYAPSLTETGQFYICLTVDGREAVLQHIQIQREEHESRVRNAVYKTVGKWVELGSGIEIDDTFAKNTRPLYEIELETTIELLQALINLEDRNADDQRDGYIELLPYRQTYENIVRKLIHRTTQVTPMTRDNEAQTTPSIPVNSWFQYQYNYQLTDLSTWNEEQIDLLRKFLLRTTDEMCDQMMVNATWDIYTNDYVNLVRNERDTITPVPTGYEEIQSFHEGKLIVNKVINDIAWHPFWSGIAIAAYSEYAKSEYLVGPKPLDEVLKIYEGENHVLVWSFNDSLTPKLILKCPREVTAVGVCPLDGNVIIGGCMNGQIVIWHIPGKIEESETVVVKTPAQEKYAIVMKGLTSWFGRELGSSVIKPTAMSSFKESQKAAITEIVWISGYNKIEKTGKLQNLPSDTAVDDLSWQFISSSEDGTLAFWDLKYKPSAAEIRQIPKKKQEMPRPEALQQSISQFKVLDRIFKPFFLLNIQHPTETRRQVPTTLSVFSPKFRKVRTENSPVSKDITVRAFYKPIIAKPKILMESKIFIGTVEGDVGCISWEGSDFETEVKISQENCRWLWIKKMHDGPVTHSVRSKHQHNFLATVGGKILAIWREDFNEPLIWKRSSIGYTACTWGNFRPTVLILARMDGSVEIWDLIVKSQEPTFIQSVSGRIITGIFTHELYLDPQCVGFCDFNGIFRLFIAPGVLLKHNKADVEWAKKFFDRQSDRIEETRKWQKAWNEANYESIEKKMETEIEAQKQLLIDAEKVKTEMTEEAQELDTAKKKVKQAHKPRQFIKRARERWRTRELQRMQQVILEKKGLRRDDLERQRAPILKLRQDAKKKKQNIRKILQLREKFFEETITFLFPEQYQEAEPPGSEEATPSKTGLSIELSIAGDKVLASEGVEAEIPINPEEEIIYDFLEVQAEALASLRSRLFEYSFDWPKVLMEGKSRRISMDTELKRLNKPKRGYDIFERKRTRFEDDIEIPQ